MGVGVNGTLLGGAEVRVLLARRKIPYLLFGASQLRVVQPYGPWAKPRSPKWLTAMQSFTLTTDS